MVQGSPFSLTSHILQPEPRMQTGSRENPLVLDLVEGKGTSNDPREYGNRLLLILFILFYFFPFSHISVMKQSFGDLKRPIGRGKTSHQGKSSTLI